MSKFDFEKINIPVRLTRLRRTQALRDMLCETNLSIKQLIYPLFINANINTPANIASMPGQMQLSLNSLPYEIENISNLGITSVLLFGIPDYKDDNGNVSLDDNAIVQQAIRKIRAINPEILIIADVCLCEYTTHGHCGILKDERINNDATLMQLAKQAISYAQQGVDVIAPSSMTDGMVTYLRNALDAHGFTQVGILSYSVKYSSSFYGPFRQAAQGAPKFGDRKTHQMNPANINEALREVSLDINEGADMVMVKPAMNYLDVISKIKDNFPEIPLCAYQVSGEYSMLKAASNSGYINEDEAILESLIAIKRAGADTIITYFAKEAARILHGK